MRDLYLKRTREATASKLQVYLAQSAWTLLEPLPTEGPLSASRILCRCVCGLEKRVAVRDILRGGSKQCRRCADCSASRQPNRVAHSKRNLTNATAANVARKKRFVESFPNQETYDQYRSLCRIGSGARQRCTNLSERSYAGYGGRGIEFRFTDVDTFARWVLDNIGLRPSPTHSIDRTDNDGHYEPGNLRWATRTEQARNKREYAGSVYGYRLRNLKKMRPDFCYEMLRTFVRAGMTDIEIALREKTTSGRKRKPT